MAELDRGRTALSEAGTPVSKQVRRAGTQVEQLRGAVTWRTVGQISAALLPLAIAVAAVFGAAQIVWAAFGLQPILQTIWGWFLSAQPWYWKLSIAGTAFAVVTGFGHPGRTKQRDEVAWATPKDPSWRDKMRFSPSSAARYSRLG